MVTTATIVTTVTTITIVTTATKTTTATRGTTVLYDGYNRFYSHIVWLEQAR